MIVALLQQILKGCSIFATRFKIKCSFLTQNLGGIELLKLAVLHFFIDSLSWLKFQIGRAHV